MDGIDVALIETDGGGSPALGPARLPPLWRRAERDLLRQALAEART